MRRVRRHPIFFWLLGLIRGRSRFFWVVVSVCVAVVVVQGVRNASNPFPSDPNAATADFTVEIEEYPEAEPGGRGRGETVTIQVDQTRGLLAITWRDGAIVVSAERIVLLPRRPQGTSDAVVVPASMIWSDGFSPLPAEVGDLARRGFKDCLRLTTWEASLLAPFLGPVVADRDYGCGSAIYTQRSSERLKYFYFEDEFGSTITVPVNAVDFAELTTAEQERVSNELSEMLVPAP